MLPVLPNRDQLAPARRFHLQPKRLNFCYFSVAAKEADGEYVEAEASIVPAQRSVSAHAPPAHWGAVCVPDPGRTRHRVPQPAQPGPVAHYEPHRARHDANLDLVEWANAHLVEFD